MRVIECGINQVIKIIYNITSKSLLYLRQQDDEWVQQYKFAA